MAEAAVDSAIRSLVDDAAADLPHRWRFRVESVAHARSGDVADALDRAVGSTRLPVRRPSWWNLASGLQWALAATMTVGLLWLLLLGVMRWFGLPDFPTPHVWELPLPTALALGGAAAGILAAAVAARVTRFGARRRAAQARRTLRRATADAARDLVLEPVDAELAALGELRGLARGGLR